MTTGAGNKFPIKTLGIVRVSDCFDQPYPEPYFSLAVDRRKFRVRRAQAIGAASEGSADPARQCVPAV